MGSGCFLTVRFNFNAFNNHTWRYSESVALRLQNIYGVTVVHRDRSTSPNNSSNSTLSPHKREELLFPEYQVIAIEDKSQDTLLPANFASSHEAKELEKAKSRQSGVR